MLVLYFLQGSGTSYVRRDPMTAFKRRPFEIPLNLNSLFPSNALGYAGAPFAVPRYCLAEAVGRLAAVIG